MLKQEGLARKISVPDVGEIGVGVSVDPDFLNGYKFAEGSVSALNQALVQQVQEDIRKARRSLAKFHQYVQEGDLSSHVEFSEERGKFKFRLYDYFRLVPYRPNERLIHPSEVILRLREFPSKILSEQVLSILSETGGLTYGELKIPQAVSLIF